MVVLAPEGVRRACMLGCRGVGQGRVVCALADCPLPIMAGAHVNERKSLAL